MTGFRGLLWRSFAVIASLLLPLAMTSAWMATVVTDSDAYVDTVGPLASDDDVQAAAVEALEGAAVGSVESATGVSLGQGSREQVSAAVAQAVGSEEFETVWRSANRTAHRQVVRILDDDGRVPTRDGRVVVELGPVFESVARTLEQRGLVAAAAVPPVQASVPLIRVTDLDRAQTAYRALDAAGFWLPALWLLLVALTLLLATERRRAGVWLGVGSIVGLVLLVLGLLVARGVVVGELGASSDYDLVRSIWDVLVSRLYWWTGIGLVVAVAALVVVTVAGRRRRPV